MSKVSNLKLENLTLTQDEIDCLHKAGAQELSLSLGIQSQAVKKLMLNIDYYLAIGQESICILLDHMITQGLRLSFSMARFFQDFL
jgi:hypothetical protein